MPLVMWLGLMLFQVRWEAPGLRIYLTRTKLLVTFCKLAHSDSGSHGSYSQMSSGMGRMELSTWCRSKNVKHLSSQDTSCTEPGIFWMTLDKLEALTPLTLWYRWRGSVRLDSWRVGEVRAYRRPCSFSLSGIGWNDVTGWCLRVPVTHPSLQSSGFFVE